MPLTPGHDTTNPPPGALLLLGGLLLAAGGYFALTRSIPDGLMTGGMGLALLAWGLLITERGHPRLMLALGVIGALASLGAALATMF